ncbi:glutamate--cysteine ligase [Alphaproteobacteria bacterium]|nr:glutamate--cysteine ligase [Alphaproteobacteria bacterium]
MLQNNYKIEDKEQLIEWFKSGFKEKKEWKVGTEHEKFAYTYSANQNKYIPLSYHGKVSVKTFLEELIKFGWNPVYEDGNIISLNKELQSITLEPGGQIELSGAPLKNLHSTCKETNEHLKLVKEVGKKLNILLVGLGVRPNEKLEEVPIMPKARYKIMRNYMPKRGGRGLEMMHSTCTVQANLDFQSEQDMIKKTRLAVKIQPIVTALFANSPFYEGSINGFESLRRHIWTDTDPDRCGVLKIALKEDFCFKNYVDYALSVPMYFIIREGKYLDCSGKSFLDFLKGNLDMFPGEKPTIEDWENHLSTIFTEVRLKKFIEVRGADAGNWRRTCALPAFWVGILYSEDSISQAENICVKWTTDDIEKLSVNVAKLGLDAKIRGEKVLDIAKGLIDISKCSLIKRNIKDSVGNNESIYLNVLEEILQKKLSPAKELLKNFYIEYDNSIEKLLRSIAY